MTGNTTCALVIITDSVGRMLERSKLERCLLSDFTKANDSVNHSNLITNVETV
jgi:hypothetical protein